MKPGSTGKVRVGPAVKVIVPFARTVGKIDTTATVPSMWFVPHKPRKKHHNTTHLRVGPAVKVIVPFARTVGKIDTTATVPSIWFATAIPGSPPKFPAAIDTGRFPTEIAAIVPYFEAEKPPVPSPNNRVTVPSPAFATA